MRISNRWNRRIRRLVGFVGSAALCGYAAWKGMQTLSIVALAAVGSALYPEKTNRIWEMLARMLGSAKSAKLGQLEFQVDSKLSAISLSDLPHWAAVLTADLSAMDVGVLLDMHHLNVAEVRQPLLSTYRYLRSHGLVMYDANTLASSKKIWLSPLGASLASELSKARRTIGGVAVEEAGDPEHDIVPAKR